jgi:hypothetical protein
MQVYEVTFKANEDGLGPTLNLKLDYDKGEWMEPVDTDDDGNEVYAIYSIYSIDQLLDNAPNVIKYIIHDETDEA